MTQFVLAILISIAVLIFMIVKLNIHPVISLFIGSMIAGSILGNDPVTTITAIANGFGGTLGSIGMTIIFGSIIACAIRDSGAAKSMVNFFIKLFHGKNLELSTGMAAYIMSIPVFGDVTMVLISPLCAIISKRQNKPMGQMAAFTILSLNLTHSMVPPTPGILAVAVLLGADLGLVILWGIVCSFIAYIITWILMRKWAGKDYYPPKPEFVEGVEEVKSNDYHDLLIKEDNLPNVLFAMSPILVPVILIALASFADMTMAEDATARVVLDTLGNRNIAMFLGMVFGWLLAVTHKEKALANYNQTSGKNEKSLFQMMFNGWVSEALEVALIPLIVTGFGGGFEQLVEVHALGRHHNLALALEVEAHGTGGSQRAIALGQGGTHFGGRTVTVIGKAFNDQTDACGSIALIDDIFVVGTAGLFTRTTLDSALDIIGRHGSLLGLVDGVVQGRVAVRIATTHTCCNLDILDQLGEQLATLRVDGGLLVLGGRPLGMT